MADAFATCSLSETSVLIAVFVAVSPAQEAFDARRVVAFANSHPYNAIHLLSLGQFLANWYPVLI